MTATSTAPPVFPIQRLNPAAVAVPKIRRPRPGLKTDAKGNADSTGEQLDGLVDPANNLVARAFQLFGGIGQPDGTYTAVEGEYKDPIGRINPRVAQLKTNIQLVGAASNSYENLMRTLGSQVVAIWQSQQGIAAQLNGLKALKDHWNGVLGELQENVQASNKNLQSYVTTRDDDNTSDDAKNVTLVEGGNSITLAKYAYHALRNMQTIVLVTKNEIEQANDPDSLLNRVAKAISSQAQALGYGQQGPGANQSLNQYGWPFTRGAGPGASGLPGASAAPYPPPQGAPRIAGNPPPGNPPGADEDGGGGPRGPRGPRGDMLRQLLPLLLAQQMANRQNGGDQPQQYPIPVFGRPQPTTVPASLAKVLSDFFDDSVDEHSDDDKGKVKDAKEKYADAGLELRKGGRPNVGSYVTYFDPNKNSIEDGILVECNGNLCVYRGDKEDVFPYSAIGSNLKSIYHPVPSRDGGQDGPGGPGGGPGGPGGPGQGINPALLAALAGGGGGLGGGPGGAESALLPLLLSGGGGGFA